MSHLNNSTICAIATTPGMGAIATIRVSGPESFTILNKIFKPKKKGLELLDQKPYSVVFGEIFDQEVILDEVLLSIFKNPQSYTGEDSIEISCHGSTYIQQSILELLIKSGASLALPGEFTQRAFLNGKMDLAQAEGVADLIASESKAMHKISLQQLKGGFSTELERLRGEMLNFFALIELELDFSEEDVQFADRTSLQKLVDTLLKSINDLIQSFSYGNAIKNGVPVAIVGRPNAGKSTLLNALLNEERAIVSDIAGTTRDTIEEILTIDGIQFRFIDTAGLRTTTDEIEKIGVSRALDKITKSAVYIYLFDSHYLSVDDVKEDLQQLSSDVPRLVIANKKDLISTEQLEEITESGIPLDFISAKKKESLELLKDNLLEQIKSTLPNETGLVVTNLRHYEALLKAKEALDRVNNGISIELPTDLLAMDMRDAAHYVGEITGNISNDEVLGHIFKNFCIGK